MAKNDKGGDAAENTGGEATAAAPAASTASKNRIILKNAPQPDGTTKDEPRADYIRRRWAEGNANRRTITDEVTNLMRAAGQIGAEDKVAYQIVFQATKGHEGGPPAAESAPAAGGEQAAAS